MSFIIILKILIISEILIEYSYQSNIFRYWKCTEIKDIKPKQSKKYLCFLLNPQVFLVKGTNRFWQRKPRLAEGSAGNWGFNFFVVGKFISSAHRNNCLQIFLLIYICGAWCFPRYPKDEALPMSRAVKMKGRYKFKVSQIMLFYLVEYSGWVPEYVKS